MHTRGAWDIPKPFWLRWVCLGARSLERSTFAVRSTSELTGCKAPCGTAWLSMPAASPVADSTRLAGKKKAVIPTAGFFFQYPAS